MSSSHYIRTIHTSFTAAHPSPWAARNSLASTPMHHHQPLYTSTQPKGLPPTAPMHHSLTTLSSSTTSPAPPSGAGGRRRAYAFRVPPATTPAPTGNNAQPKPRFDPFADEPTSPVPSLAHLASLSAPPTPRLSAASLPAPRSHQGYAPMHPAQGRRASQGQLQHQAAYQGHGQGFGHYASPTAHGPQAHAYAPHQGYPPAPRRSGFPGQRSRSPAPSFIIDSPSSAHADARSLSSYAPPTTEVWRSGSASPSPARRSQYQAYEQEFEYDLGVPTGGSGGLLMEPLTSRRVGSTRVSGPAPRRSPPPAPIARRSPSPPSSPSHSSLSSQPFQAQSPARVSVRTPSPPTPSLPPQKSAAQLQAEKQTRSKLVAGILLNRIHVQKRQTRRVPSPTMNGGEKVYVPSGLRREVLVAA